MVDNFDKIEPLLKFENSDQFYFLQILQRKKDFKAGQKVNGSNNNSRLIKAYYIHSLEYFNFIKPEVIELCKIFNARAGINLNRRSYEKMALQHLKKVTDQILNKSYEKASKAYPSVVGTYNNETDKNWIVDIDEKCLILVNTVKNIINEIKPTGNKIIDLLDSKKGYHLITKPFNILEFNKQIKDIEIHKNNPTNLYIP